MTTNNTLHLDIQPMDTNHWNFTEENNNAWVEFANAFMQCIEQFGNHLPLPGFGFIFNAEKQQRNIEKLCKQINVKPVLIGNGPTPRLNFAVQLDFTLKRVNNYNLEKLKDVVRSVQDTALDCFGKIPHPPCEAISTNVLYGMQKGTDTVSLVMYPKGTTINGQKVEEDGHYEIHNSKVVKTK